MCITENKIVDAATAAKITDIMKPNPNGEDSLFDVLNYNIIRAASLGERHTIFYSLDAEPTREVLNQYLNAGYIVEVSNSFIPTGEQVLKVKIEWHD